MLQKDLKNVFSRPKLSLITLCLLPLYNAYADEAVFYNPRVTGQFLTGGNQQLGGFGDGMIPLLQRIDKMLFADGTVLLGQNQRLTYSGGFGYRQIRDTFLGHAILGAFGFVDYYRTALNNHYTQINPGLEWLTESYETRLQGYIPSSSRTVDYANVLPSAIPANVLIDSGRTTQGLSGAVGHRIIETSVQLLEDFGRGVELEVGKRVNYGRGMWIRAGGYHYSYKNSDDINGVQVNLELAMKDNLSLIIQDNYDQQNKNRFAVGLRVNFGGSTAPKNTLEHRMTDPIIRHAARQSYGEAVPTRQTFVASGTTIFAENIWFFSPNGMFPAGAATTLENCTAEHPCSTINTPTAAKIATISPNAKFYFESGSYLIPQGSPRWANLQNGQTIWGRNTGWLTPAVGTARPLIQGGLVWGSQATNTVANGEAHNIRVLNNNQITPESIFDYGVGGAVFGLAANGRLIVENSQVDVNATSDNTSALGIAADNASIARTTVNAISDGLANVNTPDNEPLTRSDAVGVYTSNQLTTLNNSVIRVQTNGAVSNNGIARAYGVASKQSGVNVSNTTITAITKGNVNTGTAEANGINTFAGTAIVRNTTVYVSTYGNATGTSAVNVFDASANAIGVETNKADVKNSTVTVSTSGSVTHGQAIAFGVEGGVVAQGNITIPGTARVEQSTVKVSTSGNIGPFGDVFAQGVRASNAVTVNGSTVSAITTGLSENGDSAAAVGVRSFGTATVTNSTVSSLTLGSALNTVISSRGIFAQDDITSINNTISTTNKSNTDAGFAEATGVRSLAGSLKIERSTINALSTGTAINGGVVRASGVLASSGSVKFQGNGASVITAIADNGTATAAQAGSGISNTSTPPAQCSTDGINYTNC